MNARTSIVDGGFLRRAARFCARLLVSSLLAFPAWAQEFPARPLRIIVAYGPVGLVDYVPRALAAGMTPLLGQQIVVENRPGGLFMPAINEVLRAPADGYTLFVSDPAMWAILPAMQPVSYDFQRDFAPVSLTLTTGLVFVGPSQARASSISEFIAMAKAKPGALAYATPGVGTQHHLQIEALRNIAGIDIRHIPYKSAGEQAEAVLRNDVQLTAVSYIAVAPHIRSGKMRALGVGTAKRLSFAPEIASIAEQTGYAYDFPAHQGVVVRSGTPRAVIDRISSAMIKASANPELVAKVREAGAEMTYTTPEQLGEIIRSDVRKFGDIVKASGIKAQ